MRIDSTVVYVAMPMHIICKCKTGILTEIWKEKC